MEDETSECDSPILPSPILTAFKGHEHMGILIIERSLRTQSNMCHILKNLGVVQMSHAGSQCGTDTSLIQTTRSCSRSSREEGSMETWAGNSYSSERLEQRIDTQPQEGKVHGPWGKRFLPRQGLR